MFRSHEAFKRVKSLLKRRFLCGSELFQLNSSPERSVIESAAILLLLSSEISQNTSHNVQIEWHASPLEGIDGHEVQHSFRIEIFLANAKHLHLHVR